MRDLEVRGCEVRAPVIAVSLCWDFVEAGEDVSGVDQGDYAVEVDVAPEAVVDPEEWGEVAGVG